MSSSEAEFDDDVPLGKLKGNKKKVTKTTPGKVKAEPDTISSSGGTNLSSSIPRRKRPEVKYDESSDHDFEPSLKRAKTKVKASSSPKKTSSSAQKKKVAVKRESSSAKIKTEATKKKQLKKMEKADRLHHAMQAFLWWDAPEPPEGCQWLTMEHNGVSFPEPYEPHGIKMRYGGEEIELNPLQEEIATFLAAMDPDGMHLGNAKTAPIFIKNFFTDFRASLDKDKKKIIKDFKKCDFEAMRAHLNEQKLVKKAITDGERKANKVTKDKAMFNFGFAVVDGHLEKVGNYNMEPPGAFRGRGEHPKMGKIKNRVAPEQVSLNISECARVPMCSVPGHAWGELRYDPQVQWLGQWKENINGQVKYMQLAAQSSFKGKSDRSKYNKAARLCENIEKIRASYKKKLKAKSFETRQLGTAMWVIDRLALRVGGEKDTDEEADTVGCCSLRVEHIRFDPNNDGGDSREIELEFLGKDSMLFKQTIDFGAAMYNENGGMGVEVFQNFKIFCKKKKPSDQVFESLAPSMLNAHLKEIMEGLTAKVFRTYNASKTLQDELRKTEELASWRSLTPMQKVVEYNNANREVAILCNHQKSVSKAQTTQLETIGAKIDTLKDQRKTLKRILKKLKAGELKGIPVKKDEKKMVEKANKAIEKAKKMKEAAKTNEEKIEATKADEAAKQQKREAAAAKFTQAHLWEKIPTEDQVKKKIQNWSAKISKAEMDLKHKDDNKEVSLGTSKIRSSHHGRFCNDIVRALSQINYMDPRISVAWCKKNEVPIEKIFSKTLRDKFNWAMAVSTDWEFNAEVGRQC